MTEPLAESALPAEVNSPDPTEGHTEGAPRLKAPDPTERHADIARTKPIPFRKRSTWERLDWLANKLDQDGEDPIMRFAVASALKAMAIELEFAQSDGEASPR